MGAHRKAFINRRMVLAMRHTWTPQNRTWLMSGASGSKWQGAQGNVAEAIREAPWRMWH